MDRKSTWYDVIIAGAGVLGVSLAYHLSLKKPSLRILVIEKEKMVAVHASGRNAGMIRHLYRHPRLTEWALRSSKSWPTDLKSEVFKKTGSVITGRKIPNHGQGLFSEGKMKFSNSTELYSYVFSPEDGLIDSWKLVQGLKKRAESFGVDFYHGAEIHKVKKSKNKYEATLLTGENFFGNCFVNSLGAWASKGMEENLLYYVPLKAYARYLYLCRTNDRELNFGEFLPASFGFFWDEVNEWYCRKWSENEWLFSVCETIPADPDLYSPNESGIHVLTKRLETILPDVLNSLSLVSCWHCFRTYAPDLLPVWGEHLEFSGYFFLSAFGGFGMSTSFAAAEDAACYILGEEVSVCSDFLPERFQSLDNNLFKASVNG
ncbi:MAG TPA: FAD-dependent oxidoreductase [Oligoflexia bacterium]|nr:FAD-dependent oxidoreductase [Oligoflexia bacterium]HMP47468.1 FAD-dependent oxidoreductase [Oligoflexia bacterium]